ncbi:hypothetical protein [Variovorax atrisoli]|uniref:hypothetical protein n=1 Tax=Variovorax atrisoli TaxID=3394203 RepID=UPI003390B937
MVTPGLDGYEIRHLYPSRATTHRLEIAYLALPAVVFALGFLEWWVGIAVALLLSAGYVLMLLERSERPSGTWTVYVAVCAATAVMVLAGFPSGPFAWDWIKHWALVNALGTEPWPVMLKLNGTEQHLRFYLGGYLVPALSHKLLPAISLHFALGAWFFGGFVLVFRSVCTLGATRWQVIAAAIFFLVFGGADAFAEHVTRGLQKLPAAPWLGIHYEAWAANAFGLPLEFSSFLTALVWVPHQSIATFLVGGLILFNDRKSGVGAAALGYGLLALWSPYGMIGLLPLMLLRAWEKRREFLEWRTMIQVLAGVVIALCMIDYLSTELPSGGACFSCLPNRLHLIPELFLFSAVELSVFALILRKRIMQDITCLISLATLLVLPLLHGQTPDLVMRASMGPLFVLGVRSIQTIFQESRNSLRALMPLVLALCLCIPSAASEAVYIHTGAKAHTIFDSHDPLGQKWLRTVATRETYNVQEFFETCGWDFLPQYFSKEKPHLTRSSKE